MKINTQPRGSLPPERPSASKRTARAVPSPAGTDTRKLEVLVCIFILVAVGRIAELIPGLSGIPLGKITMGFAIIGVASRWKVLASLSPSVKSPLRTMAWMVAFIFVSVPFSIWPGPSVVFTYQVLPVLAAVVVLICKLTTNWASLRRITFAVVTSAVLLAASGVSSFGAGRLSTGAMYDPNDLAFVFVVILPMVLAFAFGAGNWKRRTIFFGLSVLLVVATLLTSSRGGLLGLLAIAFTISIRGIVPASRDAAQGSRRKMFRGPVSRVLASLTVFLLLTALVWPRLPEETRERLATIVNLGSDYNLDAKADMGRSQIWKRGTTALTKRPWGYGVDAYGMVDFRFGGRMQAPHNFMLQATVELGVVAGFLYLRLFWLLWRGLGRTQTLLVSEDSNAAETRQKVILCRMMQACLVGAFVSAMFLSMAYAVPLWLAFAIALGCMQQAPSPAK